MSSNRATTLEISDLAFGYGNAPVLEGLNLRLAAGEVFGLLGPNGSGKSTLVRLICGRYRPTRGTLRVLGACPRESAAARQALGLVPQEIALYPHLTARENLQVFARLAGVPRGRIGPAVEFALEVTDLQQRAEQRVSTLSGGYQRRVNIAAAIVHRPRLMILDEPTVGVDIDARLAIQEVVRQLAQDGMAVLLTTHDLEQAAQLAHRVGFLLGGRLQRQGAPAELLQEAFGDRQELQVALSRPPADAQREVLAARGLRASGDGRLWLGESSRGMDDAHALSQALEAAGLETQELRLRRPDLGSLFQRLVAQQEHQR